MSLILGIDPGLASLGWGIINCATRRFQFVGCGRITTEQQKGVAPTDDMYRRISELRFGLGLLEDAYEITSVAFEAFFLYGRQDNAEFIAMANVTGMIDTFFEKYRVAHYAPQTIKSMVAGNRNAKKPEIKRAVCGILQWIPAGRTNNHAIDALAVAICHGLVRVS